MHTRAAHPIGVLLLGAFVWLCAVTQAEQQTPGAAAPARAPTAPRSGSPASERPPEARTPQSYPRDQIEAGRAQFAAQCGFCHGRDAAGGTGGTDLTRSTLVAEDVRGDRLGPMIRAGRPAQGMPAFALSDADLMAIVAFIHDQQTQAASADGNRRGVDPSDLRSGNADAGRRYFEGACTSCHSATGDLAGVAARYQGLTLLRRMLYPRGGDGGRGDTRRPAPQTVTVSLPSGERLSGRLAYRDEFTIAITTDAGWYRSWPTAQVAFTVDDPLQRHVDQLGKYTDDDIHDVLAYLQTLR